mmetsp:Transcript_73157/g.211777  ORF Transcript_73157/g.211777 Transcript_73157/m.211777 type:complete len:289 (+) Transcript_73157:1196-2062(+)
MVLPDGVLGPRGGPQPGPGGAALPGPRLPEVEGDDGWTPQDRHQRRRPHQQRGADLHPDGLLHPLRAGLCADGDNLRRRSAGPWGCSLWHRRSSAGQRGDHAPVLPQRPERARRGRQEGPPLLEDRSHAPRRHPLHGPWRGAHTGPLPVERLLQPEGEDGRGLRRERVVSYRRRGDDLARRVDQDHRSGQELGEVEGRRVHRDRGDGEGVLHLGVCQWDQWRHVVLRRWRDGPAGRSGAGEHEGVAEVGDAERHQRDSGRRIAPHAGGRGAGPPVSSSRRQAGRVGRE